jgi:tryptophan-rich sensory protein
MHFYWRVSTYNTSMSSAFFTPCASCRKPGTVAGVCIAAAAVCVGASFGISNATNASSALRDTPATTPSAPPSVTFAVVWSVLFACGGVALALQAMSATPTAQAAGVQWTSFALLACAVVGAWLWPLVYAKSSSPTKTNATWMLAGILALVLTGVLLQNKSLVGVLWAPWLAWLIFALALAVQQTTVSAVTTTAP